MNYLKLINSQEANPIEIEHPQLNCPSSHPIVNICVNTHCNLKALYCEDQECSQFQPHEDCEHITLKSLTRSLQKCVIIKMSLKSEISSIYDALYRKIKDGIMSCQSRELPIGDLDEDEEQIIKKIYFEKQAVEINSIQAKNFSEKIKNSKIKMEKKLPLLVETLKSQMLEISNKIVEIERRILKQLESSLMQNLGQRSSKIKQAEQTTKNQQDKYIHMMQDRFQNLKFDNFTNNAKQMQIQNTLRNQSSEDMKKNYELQISNLQQQIKEQQKILQGLIQQSNSKGEGEVILIKEQEEKEQSRQEEKEKKFELQPTKFNYISKINQLYDRMLFLEKRGSINDQLLGTYEGLADELRINKFLHQSNYFYSKARYVCAKLNRRGSKEEAYQIFWIASNYNQLQNYEKALNLFNQCLKMYEKVRGKNKQQDVASTLNNIAIVYFNLQKYELAIEYNHRAIEMQKKMNKHNRINIIIYTKNIGLAYLELGKYEQAQRYFIECLQTISSNNSQTIHEECMCYDKLAQIYMLIDKMELCLEYVLKYLKRAKDSKTQQCILKGHYLDWIIQNVNSEWSNELKASADQILQTYIQVIEEFRWQFQNEVE